MTESQPSKPSERSDVAHNQHPAGKLVDRKTLQMPVFFLAVMKLLLSQVQI
jgi:hypothetical protein